ncbi:MAG: sensor histidine kinase, partial [Turicibacter sp.]
LSQLSVAANQMAKGEYNQILNVKGQDELALLMDSFNQMSIQVEKGIKVLRQEAENKQLFIDNFSHELRTPLTIIQGYAQMVQHVKLDEEQRLKYLQYIISESNRMQRMSNELLQLTVLKHEEKRCDLFNNEVLIKKVIEPFFMISEQKSIQLEIEFDTSNSYGNEVLIENLMINLINNAMNACEPGGMVFVSLYKNHLIVKDDGIGMSEECQQHLFEPFYREDKSRTRKSGGVGLGMAISKQIVDYHAGKISVLSVKGEGTTIEVKF